MSKGVAHQSVGKEKSKSEYWIIEKKKKNRYYNLAKVFTVVILPVIFVVDSTLF